MFLAAAVFREVSASLGWVWGGDSSLDSNTTDFHVIENFLGFS